MVTLIFSAIILISLIIALVIMIVKKPKSKTKSSDIDKSILELIPIGDYDFKNECFLYNDGSCMDIFQIRSKDLADTSQEERDFMKMKFSKWYRKYAQDIKLIMMNFPCNTKVQRDYFEYKLENTINEKRKKWLRKNIAELEWIEKNRTEREFYCMYWGKDIEELLKNREIHVENLGTSKMGYMNFISPVKKENIIFKYNNACSLISQKEAVE